MKFLTDLFFNSNLLKIAAVSLMLYFALYKYDESPDSIAKRFTEDSISKDMKIAKEQTKKIVQTISYVRSVENKRENEEVIADYEKIRHERSLAEMRKNISAIDKLKIKTVVKPGSDAGKFQCSDRLLLSYKITDDDNQNILYSVEKGDVEIHDYKDVLFLRLARKMKEGQVVELTIDQKYNFLPNSVKRYYLKSSGKITLNLKFEGVTMPSTMNSKFSESLIKEMCN